jgi:hypothetical protein
MHDRRWRSSRTRGLRQLLLLRPTLPPPPDPARPVAVGTEVELGGGGLPPHLPPVLPASRAHRLPWTPGGVSPTLSAHRDRAVFGVSGRRTGRPVRLTVPRAGGKTVNSYWSTS